MCLHQLENHEPVEFGELGIDPVERDQVTYFMPLHIFQASKYYTSQYQVRKFSPQFKNFVHHRYHSILMTLPD